MTTQRIAVIDLGTNTFHLLIVEASADGNIDILFSEKKASRIGKGGISQSIITEDAIVRAIENIRYFRQIINQYEPAKIYAMATSAFRNASNGTHVAQLIYEETGITIEIISGEREAEYIYYGVKLAVPLSMEPSLIVDIGGGSVEYIIGNNEKIFWKKSIEMGGQRLLDMFQKNDPITPEEIENLIQYFNITLLELDLAIHQYKPTTFIGSSGSFDTLSEMDIKHKGILYDLDKEKNYTLSSQSFNYFYQLLIRKNRAERMLIPGMIELRVDMIVVSSVLIHYILSKYNFPHIVTSTYAMKEGVIAQLISGKM
ncbi:MAG: phosphatase [Cytophagaceae bacterium]|nr:phosphatase [Cytophagaceae bacterium]MDW8456258.1 phosphatase [Cytophagaceae bacterium]